jgi:glycosyltransferase involved in cell wall biosynthesis
MISVLHVVQPTEAGVAAYVTALCGDQVARGWNVTAACPDGGRLATELTRAGVHRVAWQARRAPGATVAREVLQLRRLLDRVRPDIVHLHSSKAGLAGRLAVRGRLPTLFQPHGWSWLAAPRGAIRATLAWERAAARWTTLFVCVGSGEAEQGHAYGLRGRYTVVRSGVDLRRFRPADEADRHAARVDLSIPPDAPVAACIGRVTPQKGQDVLLTAWPAVLGRCPDARLVILGGGESRRSLAAQAPPSTLFHDPVRDVRPWYAAADVVVLPSRWEGLSLTLLEALASGRPVVASDIPGLAEAIPRGAGALVPPDDPAALARAVAHRLTHPTQARAEGLVAARYTAVEADVRRAHERLAAITARMVTAGRP